MSYFFDPTTINPKFKTYSHGTAAEDIDALVQLPLMIAPRPEPVVVVELGSFVGTTALALAATGRVDRIFCIDTWEGTPGEEVSPISLAFRDFGGDGVYRTFLENVGDFLGSVITPLRMPSVEAATLPQMRDLDFVFIDADHSYEGCKADIEAWLPRVRPGGICAGHDYCNFFPGVMQAVNEREELQGSNLIGTVWWKRL